MTAYINLDDFGDASPEDESETTIQDSGVVWPPGYSLRSDGLWYEPGEDKNALQLSGPFYVLGLARDPDGQGWSIALTWTDPDGRPHRAFVPRADLLGTGVDALRPLVASGLIIAQDPGRIRLFKQALAQLECRARVRLVKSAGWHGAAFVLPNRTIGSAADETIVFDGQAGAARYATNGTLRDWIKQVAAPATANSRLVLALSTAFAGPLNDLLQWEGGGVHLVGSSSSGKSTALVAAGSVWGGGGRAGFVHTWRATGNGLESIARSHSGTLLALDELGEIDPREAAKTIYMLGNGVSKIRATREADTRPRAEWRAMLLSAGEIGLADKIVEAGGGRRPGHKCGSPTCRRMLGSVSACSSALTAWSLPSSPRPARNRHCRSTVQQGPHSLRLSPATRPRPSTLPGPISRRSRRACWQPAPSLMVRLSEWPSASP
ncbi:DUF927 domain-containing protein [Methylobacterium durans]|nr:DUF927 domain-containing protein [Methylobacterium durans]